MAYMIRVENERGEHLAGMATAHAKYLLPDGQEMFISTQVVWCETCRAFRSAEDIPSLVDLDRETQDFPEKWEALPLEVDASHELFELFRGVRKRFIEESVVNMRVWRQCLNTRQSPPRCLSCGGVELIPVGPENQCIDHPVIPGRIRFYCYCHADLIEESPLYTTEGLPTTRKDGAKP